MRVASYAIDIQPSFAITCLLKIKSNILVIEVTVVKMAASHIPFLYNNVIKHVTCKFVMVLNSR